MKFLFLLGFVIFLIDIHFCGLRKYRFSAAFMLSITCTKENGFFVRVAVPSGRVKKTRTNQSHKILIYFTPFFGAGDKRNMAARVFWFLCDPGAKGKRHKRNSVPTLNTLPLRNGSDKGTRRPGAKARNN